MSWENGDTPPLWVLWSECHCSSFCNTRRDCVHILQYIEKDWTQPVTLGRIWMGSTVFTLWNLRRLYFLQIQIYWQSMWQHTRNLTFFDWQTYSISPPQAYCFCWYWAADDCHLHHVKKLSIKTKIVSQSGNLKLFTDFHFAPKHTLLPFITFLHHLYEIYHKFDIRKLQFDWLAVILVYYVLLTWCIFLYKSTFNKCIELTDTLSSVGREYRWCTVVSGG